MLSLNYPSNPTILTKSAPELQELAKVAAHCHVVLLCNEIFGQRNFEGRHISIARFYPEGTIISSGPSKWCGAGGGGASKRSCSLAIYLGCRTRWPASVVKRTLRRVPPSSSPPCAPSGGNGHRKLLVVDRRFLRGLGYWCAARLAETGATVLELQGLSSCSRCFRGCAIGYGD